MALTPKVKAEDKARILKMVDDADGPEPITEILVRALVEPGRYQGYRQHDVRFREMMDEKMRQKRQRKYRNAADSLVFTPGRAKRPKPTFPQWRREYLGRPVSAHQQPIVQAYEDRTNNKIMVLGPTGMGKDTTAGDLCMYETCDNWNVRVAWIMESAEFAMRRISERIEPYLTDPNTYRNAPLGPDTSLPARSLIDDYGPFTWTRGLMYPDGTPVPKNTWTKHALYFLGDGAPEQDPNLWATGIGGSTYGSRINLMICSDIFTAENQANASLRDAQLNWLGKTARTRLDGSGRLMFLGTRVAGFDNWGNLLDRWTANARVIYEDGYYTKYSNGFASVIIPAIDVDEHGNETSFWPDNPEFRLDSCIVLDGVYHDLNSITDREAQDLAAAGGHRIDGLRDKRLESQQSGDDTFETTQMQRPPNDDAVEFTDEILDHPNDPARTIGVVRAGEILIQGVDPARVAGAAWAVLGVDLQARTITFIDGRAHRKLGTEGIKEELILAPARRYQPAYLRFEKNREEAVLDYPDVGQELKANAVKVEREHTTGVNRNTDDYRVAKMVEDMRNGTLRWPHATIEDRKRMQLVKQHFKHWDERETAREQGRARPKVPDDLAMAVWLAWRKARELLDRRKPKTVHRERDRVPLSVRRRWGRQHPIDIMPPAPVMDLAAAYFGGDD